MHIRFRVKEKGGSTIALGNLSVNDGHPPTVGTFGLRPLPPEAVLVNMTLDASTRKKVIDGVETNLKEYYVEPTLAQQMADALKVHAAKGDYDAISDGDAFASQLTQDLQEVSHDKHLNVTFSPFKIPPRAEPTPEEEARLHRQMEHDNCAFDKVADPAGSQTPRVAATVLDLGSKTGDGQKASPWPPR
jgi:retinol-binding protein 3